MSSFVDMGIGAAVRISFGHLDEYEGLFAGFMAMGERVLVLIDLGDDCYALVPGEWVQLVEN